MNEYIDWNQVPDVITKDQFYRICHISKQTARYLLQSGIVPCKYTGKKTRCYSIQKKDVQEYLHQRGLYPEKYTAPAGWYGTPKNKSVGMPKELSQETLEKLHSYYTALLVECPDVLSAKEVVSLTGYSANAVSRWCGKRYVRHFVRKRMNYIPKVFLVDFFCSEKFRTISRKSKWHIRTLHDFQQRQKDEKRSAKGAKKRG